MKALIQKFTDFLANQNSISNSVRIESPSFISGSTISGNTRIAANCKIYKSFLQGNIEMGRFSSIWGPNTYIISHEHKVRIKQFVSIARNVSVQESNHKIHTPSSYNILRNVFGASVWSDMDSKGDIIIGNDVWIGAHAVILSGTTIGNGAVIGANTVITKDVLPYAIVVGSPATVVKYRFSPELIEALEALQWWNWDIEKIKRNRTFFEADVTLDSIKSIQA